MEILMKMFYGGLALGTMLGMAIMIIITLIALKIEERNERKEEK